MKCTIALTTAALAALPAFASVIPRQGGESQVQRAANLISDATTPSNMRRDGLEGIEINALNDILNHKEEENIYYGKSYKYGHGDGKYGNGREHGRDYGRWHEGKGHDKELLEINILNDLLNHEEEKNIYYAEKHRGYHDRRNLGLLDVDVLNNILNEEKEENIYVNKHDDHKYDDYDHDDHKYEEPKYESKYDDYKYEEPKYEEPKYEKPKYEEPKKEEPKKEEPKKEVKHEEPKYEVKHDDHKDNRKYGGNKHVHKHDHHKQNKPKCDDRKKYRGYHDKRDLFELNLFNDILNKDKEENIFIEKYEDRKYDGNKYEDYKYDDHKYDGHKYSYYKHDDRKYENHKYDDDRFDGHKYGDYKYDDHTYDDHKYGDHRDTHKYDDRKKSHNKRGLLEINTFNDILNRKKEENLYFVDKYDDHKYNNHKYEDYKYEDNKYDEDRKYGDYKYNDHRYDSHKYGDRKYDEHRYEDHKYDDRNDDDYKFDHKRHREYHEKRGLLEFNLLNDLANQKKEDNIYFEKYEDKHDDHKYQSHKYEDEKYDSRGYDDRKYDDHKFDGHKYTDSDYDDHKYSENKYDDRKHNEDRKYDNHKYGNNKYDDQKYNEDRKYDDHKHVDRKYDDYKHDEDRKHGDNKYDDPRHNEDRKYDDHKHGDSKYEDHKYDEDRKYGFPKHDDHQYEDHKDDDHHKHSELKYDDHKYDDQRDALVEVNSFNDILNRKKEENIYLVDKHYDHKYGDDKYRDHKYTDHKYDDRKYNDHKYESNKYEDRKYDDRKHPDGYEHSSSDSQRDYPERHKRDFLDIGAVNVLSRQINELDRRDGPTDIEILNFALTLEHLEAAFYKQGLAKYSKKAFKKAGHPEWIRGRFEQIAAHEETHVQFLTSAITAAGAQAVEACEYQFPDTDPNSFIDTAYALESVGVSAYNGAAAFINNKAYLTVAASILGVEARHSAWISSTAKNSNPWSTAFETPLDLNQVYSIASGFIKKCPESNPPLPVKAFPSLVVSGYAPGKRAHAEFDCKGQKNLYAAFLVGTGTIFTRIEDGKYEIDIPKGLKGFVYVVITNDSEKVSDETTVAGPAILNFPFGAYERVN